MNSILSKVDWFSKNFPNNSSNRSFQGGYGKGKDRGKASRFHSQFDSNSRSRFSQRDKGDGRSKGKKSRSFNRSSSDRSNGTGESNSDQVRNAAPNANE